MDARSVEYPNVSPAARHLLKVSGTARGGGEMLDWSLVLKAYRRPDDPDAAFDDPPHYDYWQREALFFESGLAANLPPGLRCVRGYGVDRKSAGEVWLWLESLSDDHPEGWPPSRFELAARHLGQFGGAYAAGRPLPSFPWLAATRSVQVQYSIAHPSIREPVLRALESPPAGSRSTPRPFGRERDRIALRDAFVKQEAFLETLDRVPRTLCHNDTMGANLFAQTTPDGASETVAIDWALVGVGPLGVDIAQLVAGSACFFRSGVDQLDELDRRTFDAYVDGVALTGAEIRGADVRRACLVTILCQWSAVVAFHLVMALDPAEEAWVTEFWHRPPRDVVEQFAPLLAFLTRRARETIELADAT
jgi:phosphotransferase family enzyme